MKNDPPKTQRCTCPSGDGSLRWPCPTHPAEAHCTTCACVPGVTPAVRFDATPAEKDGAVRDHLIRMGWTPPAEAQENWKQSAEKAEKWWGEVCDALSEADPDWMLDGPGGIESAVAMIRKLAARPAEAQSVGEAGSLPGSNGGFTTAVFKASDVPVGAKLYTAPPSAPVGVDESNLMARLDAIHRQVFGKPYPTPVGVEGHAKDCLHIYPLPTGEGYWHCTCGYGEDAALAQQPAAECPDCLNDGCFCPSCNPEQPAAAGEMAELVGLLDEVRSHFTRDDDLPGDLLPRIDAALAQQGGE